MSNERTEQLIINLAAGLTPVKRLPPVSTRAIRWLAFSAVVVAVAVGTIGARADLSVAIWSRAVLEPVGLALAVAIAAALGGLSLSVPGADQSRWVRWGPSVLVAVWALALVEMSRSAGPVSASVAGGPIHMICVLRVVAIAVVPAVALIWSLRRGFALDRVWASALAVLGGGAVGAIGVQFACPIDQPAHVLASHAAPVILLMLLGAGAGKSATPSASRAASTVIG